MYVVEKPLLLLLIRDGCVTMTTTSIHSFRSRVGWCCSCLAQEQTRSVMLAEAREWCGEAAAVAVGVVAAHLFSIGS